MRARCSMTRGNLLVSTPSPSIQETIGEALRHKAQQRRSFRECAALGHQSGNAPFRVDREVCGAPLALGAKIDQNRLVVRTGLFKRDVRRESTGAGSIVKLVHNVRPPM